MNVLSLSTVATGAGLWLATAMIGGLSFVLGFAMNHGSICTVIATTELIEQKRPARFVALVECALWAAIGYTVLGASPTMQDVWAPVIYLAAAACVFGVGIYVNGACIFGSVGHFGNGDIDFGFTFLGVLAVLCFAFLIGGEVNQMPVSAAPPIGLQLLILALAALLVVRFSVFNSGKNFQRLTLAMCAIGMTSAVISVLAPRFSITTTIGSILSIPVAGILIFICMFGGSLVSARLRNRRFVLKRPTRLDIIRRMLGGLLMGLGALLIPGGNDTLLLVGFPMGAWQAVLAYLLIVATLALLIARFGSTARSWS
ncbi:YeeE/YedE thiosulfate transporter family protein [Rhizobium bangladeshense]|uniref:YeeE/YedE thiosulfate transporter family protein n=1 Tax=Rhizobium bangladeshense TaxID=1138189 RepID=UPI00287F8244|nr:YeeE/YedE thiosulfate transporter family protein [Rhizobium bangladeshense]